MEVPPSIEARATAACERAASLIQRAATGSTAVQELLAQQAAELTTLREKVANLEIALESNRRIAMAIGIIMARELVTEDQAFALLREASQHSHCKLRVVAEQIVTTGELPSVPDRPLSGYVRAVAT